MLFSCPDVGVWNWLGVECVLIDQTRAGMVLNELIQNIFLKYLYNSDRVLELSFFIGHFIHRWVCIPSVDLGSSFSALIDSSTLVGPSLIIANMNVFFN